MGLQKLCWATLSEARVTILVIRVAKDVNYIRLEPLHYLEPKFNRSWIMVWNLLVRGQHPL
jgi:hypothetical protein